MKTLRLHFDDKIFKKLKNAKEEKLITDDKIKNWEDYILWLKAHVENLEEIRDLEHEMDKGNREWKT